MQVVYLKQRRGFVRMAVSAGVPIIPVFAFGQRLTFKWSFPRSRWHTRLSRALLFAPMAFWGVWGSPIPYCHPITVVVGAPIPTRLGQRDTSTDTAGEEADNSTVSTGNTVSTVGGGLMARKGAKARKDVGLVKEVDVGDGAEEEMEHRVRVVHAEYLDTVTSLYEKYKAVAGVQDVPLEIL